MSINYPIHLLVADDHVMLREGFHTLLKKNRGIVLVGEAANGFELVELAEKLNPDVIITDIKMPGMDGIEATNKLLEKNPHFRILAFTMFEEENLIIDMLVAGAKGYLLKSSGTDEILEAITAVMQDKNYYCRETTSRLAHMIAVSTIDKNTRLPKPVFTPKELTVVRMICQQLTNKEIAAALNISVRTVEGHRDKIFEKMKVTNMAGIVVYAIKTGIYKI
jgi:DNA-binding NarL/FixJ family response regulator